MCLVLFLIYAMENYVNMKVFLTTRIAIKINRFYSTASNIKVCSRNDPNISKCIIDSIRILQPRLASGNLAPDFKVTVSYKLLIPKLFQGQILFFLFFLLSFHLLFLFWYLIFITFSDVLKPLDPLRLEK